MKTATFLRCLMFCLSICAMASIAVAAETDGPPPLPRSTVHLSEEELKIWNDPAFKEQFVESYKSETEIEPKVTAKERDQLLKIFDLIQADKMDEARELIEKNMDPASSGVFDFTLANIYFQEEKLGDAARYYQSAIKKHAKFRRAWRNLALIYIRQSDYKNAIPTLGKVIELGGGDAITYGLLGFAYSSVEDNLPAESAYRMANMLDPRTMDWKMGLARSFFKQERFTDAAALCKRLIADNPRHADLWLLQANAFIGLGEPMKAAENYEIVDQLGKSTPASLYTLADIYVNAKVYDAAVRDYIRAMDLGTESVKQAVADGKTPPENKPDRVIRAAKVLAALGATDQTQQLLEHVEKVFGSQLSDAEHKDLLKLHARIAVAQGADAEQARMLEQIIQIDPMDGDALILLGQYHADAGLEAAAAAKVAEADKDTKTAEAKQQAANDQLARAVFYYERAEGIDKFEADAKVRHAQLLVKQARYAEALPLLRSAQQVKPRDNIEQYIKQIERAANVR